ncbi:MAG: RagB/SusD family nutrient uptake outer membrane protein [Bacteroidales bacterium]|nr:RagB/SusD family nutrient uptake outer membrane protein [Bacteroidales bacterium]
MKKIILFSVLIAALCSCADFLDIRTEATMPSSGLDYTKTENIIMPLSAAYAKMRLEEGDALNYMAVLEIASDDADKGSSADDGPNVKEVDEFTLAPTNDCVNSVWAYFFDMASAANYAIESMDRFEEAITAEAGLQQAAECRDEARIIRAWAYFNLVRIFGPVPLIDKTMTSAELASMTVSSEDEIYNFVYSELDKAIAGVPASWDGYPGRYTSWTARALKSKVALYRKDWKEAAAQANAIIASGEFSLMPNFRDVFSMKGENSPEILMSIQSSTLGQSSGSAPICFYAFIQGPRNNSPSNMQGWGFKVPSQKLINFLDGRGDAVRKATTILESGTTTPEGDAILATCANPYYNGKVYTPSRYNKWSFNGYGFDYDMRLIRYAEVLLNYAEAVANGAPAGVLSADEALNQVRRRAGLEDATASLEVIYDERRAELALEENRFFDLVRWGKAAEVLGPLGFKAGKHEHFPIPSSQRQLNPNLPASAGYSY